jgi:anti-sigma regulatory factor (Ser/Thr protein kinase)
MKVNFEVEGGDFTHAGLASSEVKKLLKQLSLDSQVIKRIVIALYEAEVNVVAHAYKGNIELDIDPDKIVIVIDDQGPGIPDISKAMEVGYSTASPQVREMGFGAGMGLPNIKKNVDELDIASTVGKGTTLKMTTYFCPQ